MKIILTSDVEKVGHAGDVIEVKNGYGRNYLIPQNLGILATAGAMKQIEGIKRTRQARIVRDNEHAQEIKRRIENIGTLTIPVKTSDTGKLFGSVTSAEIAKKIKDAIGHSVDKRTITIPGEHIKSLGPVTVKIAIASHISAALPIDVVAA